MLMNTTWSICAALRLHLDSRQNIPRGAHGVLSRRARHSHLPLKKIVPDSLELRGGRSKDENASSGSTVWAATAAVYRLGVTVVHAAVRVYGNLQSKFRRSLSHGEACLSDTRQSQRFFGDEKHTVSRYPREH